MYPCFLVNATAPSPAIGMGCVEYDILNGDGETVRSITRRFTMANVQIRADLDDDGSVTSIDSGLRSVGLGAGFGGLWLIPRRATPYRISLQNECATWDGALHLSLTEADSTSSVLRTGMTTNSPALIPGESTNATPFCVRNTSTTLWLDTSAATDTVAVLNYSLDFEGNHQPISDSLYLRAVDIDIPDFVARTNETASIVYDYTHVYRDILWTLTNQDAGTTIETRTGATYSPPDGLPPAEYRVQAQFFGVFENGDYVATRTGKLCVTPIVLEPVTNVRGPDGRLYNPASVVVNGTGRFKITVADPRIPDSDIVWSGDDVDFVDDRNTGRIVEVIPKSGGDKILTVTIKNHVGPLPQIVFYAFNSYANIPVHFTFVCNNGGQLPTEVDNPLTFATNWLYAASVIMEQACVFLSLAEDISIVTNGNWFVIERDSAEAFVETVNDICYSHQPVQGLWVCVVQAFTLGQVTNEYAVTMSSGNTPYGTIIPSYANYVTLVHELCHGCSLADIYVDNLNMSGAVNQQSINQLLISNDMPSDKTGLGFYYPIGEMRETRYSHLLMLGNPSVNHLLDHVDIPRGRIYGLKTEDYVHFTTGMVSVGISTLNRNPHTLGGTP